LIHATTIAQKPLYFIQGNRFSIAATKFGTFKLFRPHKPGDCRTEIGISIN